MKKIYISGIILVLFSSTLSAQWSWVKRQVHYTGNTNACVWPRDVAVDASDNIISCGYYAGEAADQITFDGILASGYAAGAFHYSGYIAKYNSSGAIQWVQRIGSGGTSENGYVQVNGVTSDAAGNVYAVGSFGQSTRTARFGGSLTSNTGGIVVTSSYGEDGFIAKYNSAGTFQWVKTITAPLAPQGSKSVEGIRVSSTAIYVIGSYDSRIDFGSGVTLTSKMDGASYTNDIFIAKYDIITGNCSWAQSAGSNKTDYGYGIAMDVWENIFVTGTFQSQATFGSVIVTNGGGAGSTTNNIYLAKYNSLGTCQWVKTGWSTSAIGSGFYHHQIGIDNNNDLYLTESLPAGASINFGISATNPSGTLPCMYIAKINNAGTHQWTMMYNSAGGISEVNGISASGNSVYVGGKFTGPGDFGNYDLAPGPWGQAVFLLQLDKSTGLVTGSNMAGGSGVNTYSPYLYNDNSGNLIVSGSAYGGSVPMNFGTNTITLALSTGYISKLLFCSPTGITSQTSPSSVTICSGNSQVFSVTASGSPTLSYQWQLNGSNISGATNASYTATSPGAYSCVVTNSCGTVTSNAATLTVNALSAGGTATAAASTICAGTNTTITLTGYTGSIQWQTNASGLWANIPGATSPTYITPVLTATTSYRAIVTNGVCSSATSSVAVVTVSVPANTNMIAGDYVWSGNTSIDWAVPTNWLVYQGAGVYAVATAIPDSSKNVFIRAYTGCASNLCNILNSYTGHCKSITIESSLTMGTASVLNVARNWTNTLGTLNPGTGTVAFNGQKLTTGTIYTGGVGAGKQFYNIEIKSASNTSLGSNDGNKVNLEGNIRINNNFVLTSGYQFNVNSGSTMSIGGNFTHNVCEFNRGLGSVTLTGSSKLIDGAAATYFRILNISGSYTLTEPSIYLWSNPLGDYGDLNILAGGSLNATDKTIYIDGNWTNQGTFTAGTSTVSFERSYDQAVFSGGSRFYNFRMNRTATPPYVTLTDPAWITGNGNFLHGVVQYSGTGSLTFTDNATSNGGADTSFVDEPVIKIGNENFVFPVGQVTTDPTWRFVWAPLGIANTVGVATDQFNCEYFFTASPHNLDPLYMCNPSILNHTSGMEYWNLDRNVGTSIPFVTLYWKNGTRSGITNLSDLVVAHWENCPTSGTDKWSSKEGAVTGGSTLASGSITNTIVFPNFSPVTFGTKLNTNPLPVELLNFAAKCTNNDVYISWATATESNNDYFTIQRSADANNWEFVKSIPGGGSSNTILYYSAIDNDPFNGTSYYRLKQTDFNGHSETYHPATVTCGTNENLPQISYYPNPFTSDVVVDIQNLKAEKATLVIYDMLGKKVFDKIINSDELLVSKFTISLQKLAAGVYTVNFTSEEFNNTSRIVKNF